MNEIAANFFYFRMHIWLFNSSPEREVLKVSYCDRSMSVIRRACSRASSVVRRQQFALKAYSSYTPRPFDSKLGRKHWGDL